MLQWFLERWPTQCRVRNENLEEATVCLPSGSSISDGDAFTTLCSPYELFRMRSFRISTPTPHLEGPELGAALAAPAAAPGVVDEGDGAEHAAGHRLQEPARPRGVNVSLKMVNVVLLCASG